MKKLLLLVVFHVGLFALLPAPASVNTKASFKPAGYFLPAVPPVSHPGKKPIMLSRGFGLGYS